MLKEIRQARVDAEADFFGLLEVLLAVIADGELSSNENALLDEAARKGDLGINGKDSFPS
jgi:hypothetical protein